jgi:hypothetical protein
MRDFYVGELLLLLLLLLLLFYLFAILQGIYFYVLETNLAPEVRSAAAVSEINFVF